MPGFPIEGGSDFIVPRSAQRGLSALLLARRPQRLGLDADLALRSFGRGCRDPGLASADPSRPRDDLRNRSPGDRGLLAHRGAELDGDRPGKRQALVRAAGALPGRPCRTLALGADHAGLGRIDRRCVPSRAGMVHRPIACDRAIGKICLSPRWFSDWLSRTSRFIEVSLSRTTPCSERVPTRRSTWWWS